MLSLKSMNQIGAWLSPARALGSGPRGRRFKSARPDLILLDLNLPKRDGREVLGIIRADPSLRSIPVVIVSTSDREEDIRYALGSGARAYISKSRGFDRYSDEISEVIKYVQ